MIVKHLVKAGLMVDQPNQKGQTPLHYAVIYSNEGTTSQKIIHFLRLHDANPHHKDNDGKTALDIASEKVKEYLLEPLLSEDINQSRPQNRPHFFNQAENSTSNGSNDKTLTLNPKK